MSKISFYRYYWNNSRVALLFIVVVFPLFTLAASLIDGKFVGGGLLFSAFLLAGTLIRDFIKWRKR